MARRSPGEGSVFQRPDGRWQASLQVNGIRKSVYGKTAQEARQKLAALQKQVALLRGFPDAGRRTVNDLLDAWLEVCAPSWRASTLESNREVCALHIRPALGKVRLERLSPVQVQRLTATLQKQDKERTALKVYAVLHRACELATLWGWLTVNPCKRMPRPAYRPERKPVWAAAQLETFLRETQGHALGPLWAFLAATGCRLGEALGLSWESVNWETGTVAIAHNLQRVGGRWVLERPKTHAGERAIALPTWAVAALKRQKARQAEWRLRAGASWANEWALVFTRENGAPLQGTNVARALREACIRLGLPPLSPHGLRHLHASLLLEAGIAIPQVARRLGHADPRITLQVYGHAIGEDAAADALQRAVRG